MKLKDGRIFDCNGYELFTLTERQQDEIIRQLYPSDTILLSTSEIAKRQKSWSGYSGFDLDRFATIDNKWTEEGTCEIADSIYQLGGTKLLTLYCNKFNFFSAAKDLNITYGALMKWFQRWRLDKIGHGLTAEDLLRIQ